MYLHFTLQPGAKLVQAVPRDYNAFVYVIDGKGLFGINGQHA
jgi:redox-sensitive bicupin YhaK (pirin superfamily)